jgi:signal transduction histidine kinase
VLLSSARRIGDPERVDTAIQQAISLIGDGIAHLRALIIDLRPAALDELGTEAAVEALARRVSAQTGLEIELDMDLAFERGRSGRRHTPEIELAAYRLVQEALTNVTKHAGAGTARVRIAELEDEVIVEVRDDGRGFDPRDGGDGFGLVGMRERVAAVGGTFEVASRQGAGTLVAARIPVVRRAPEGGDAAGEERPAPADSRTGAPSVSRGTL